MKEFSFVFGAWGARIKIFWVSKAVKTWLMFCGFFDRCLFVPSAHAVICCPNSKSIEQDSMVLGD